MKEIKKISELLNNYTNKIEKIIVNNSGNIINSWNEIIEDERLSSHCKLENIKSGIAVIHTNHHGWSQQIMMKKNKIIHNLKKKYPELEIKNISVIVNSGFEYETFDKKNEYMQKTENGINNPIITDRTEEKYEDIKDYKKEIPIELKDVFNKLKKAISKKNN